VATPIVFVQRDDCALYVVDEGRFETGDLAGGFTAVRIGQASASTALPAEASGHKQVDLYTIYVFPDAGLLA